MKRAPVPALLITLMLFAMSACASHDEITTEQTTGAVPGEKVAGEGMTPGAGPGGASANVKW